jgi:glycosyltransferase involved in cell wall biosynthesis
MEKILELPKVSILTPTFNRSSFSPLAIKNILDTEYPKEKIEWIILDDSNDGSSWEEILKENKHLLPKYIYLQREKKMNISQKRNYLCKNSSNPILVFMDDDDIYLPQHLINRVRPLINNTRIELVGSKDMLLYFGYDNTYRWKMNNEPRNICMKELWLFENHFGKKEILVKMIENVKVLILYLEEKIR